MGYYSILFYFTHVITIVAVANFIFYLKDVDPRFREGEDSNFNDIPSLVEHKKLLELQGKVCLSSYLHYFIREIYIFIISFFFYLFRIIQKKKKLNFLLNILKLI